MRWSFRVGRIRETEVRIHVTLLLLLAWYGWSGWREAGGRAAAEQVAFLVLLFVSILLHEFGHVAAARRYGIATPDVTLTPIGGVARIAELPRHPRQELVIALGGPLVTLLIALLIGGALALGPGLLLPDAPGMAGFWAQLGWTNLALLVFNLIPAFPMDGGRVLRALLAARFGLLRGTRWATLLGRFLAATAALAVFAGYGSPLLLLIAFFVYFAADAEYAEVRRREAADRHGEAGSEGTPVAVVPPAFPLARAAEVMLAERVGYLPVIDEAGRFHGLLVRDDLLRAAATGGMDGTAGGALPTGAPRLVVGMDRDAMAERLLASGREALPVVDEGERLVGVVSRDMLLDVTLLERLRARSAPTT